MLRTKTTLIALTIAATMLAAIPSEANADGPLRRWLRGFKKPAAGCCGAPAQQAPQTAACAPNAANLKPGQCMKTCMQTCTRTVVNYVPCTAYRTVTKRVPVTQYRPETKTDPCTGCTITCMKPCTTYTCQVQRVPYTTYRPVYRQESYKVPVTTIYNDCCNDPCATGTCATGNCATGTCATAGCNTCGPTQTPIQPNYAPTPAPAPQTSTYYESAPGVTTGSSYGNGNGGFTPTPADQSPTLNPTSSQRPVTDRLNSSGEYQASHGVPARINIQETASRSPIHRQWSYSPIRLASYEQPATNRVNPVQNRQPVSRNQVQSRTNWNSIQPVKRNGWVEVN